MVPVSWRQPAYWGGGGITLDCGPAVFCYAQKKRKGAHASHQSPRPPDPTQASMQYSAKSGGRHLGARLLVRLDGLRGGGHVGGQLVEDLPAADPQAHHLGGGGGATPPPDGKPDIGVGRVRAAKRGGGGQRGWAGGKWASDAPEKNCADCAGGQRHTASEREYK